MIHYLTQWGLNDERRNGLDGSGRMHVVHSLWISERSRVDMIEVFYYTGMALTLTVAIAITWFLAWIAFGK